MIKSKEFTKWQASKKGLWLLKKHIQSKTIYNKKAKSITDGIAQCCDACSRNPSNDSVRFYRRGHKISHEGLQHCDKIWLCPMCAYRMSRTRAAEVNHCLEWHMAQSSSSNPRSADHITMTAHHTRYDSLKNILDDMKKALASFKRSRSYHAYLKTSEGNITATEITHGLHGWHPHFHMLALTNIPKIDANNHHKALKKEWHRSLAKVKRRGNKAAFKVQTGDKAGDYLTKNNIALELTDGAMKEGKTGNKTPFQLAELNRMGDLQSGKLFKAYAKETHLKRQLMWSRGLKAKCGLDEFKSEQLESEIIEKELIKMFSFNEWNQIRSCERYTMQGLEMALMKEAIEGNHLDGYLADLMKTNPSNHQTTAKSYADIERVNFIRRY